MTEPDPMLPPPPTVPAACPNCGRTVEIDGPFSAATLQCPACLTPFTADAALRSDSHLPATPAGQDDELDGQRIRQFATLRRGAYRARSYAIIGAVACAVTAVQLVVITAQSVAATGWRPVPIGCAMFAFLGFVAATYFVRRAMDLHRELKAPASLPPPPPGGPDFSTLSDGSQQWKNLDEIR